MIDTRLEEDTNNRYRVERILGEDEYKILFLAIDKNTNDYVVIKKLEKVFGAYSDPKRVLREIKILQTLKHENVSSLIDVMVPKTQNFCDYNSVIVVRDFMEADLRSVIRGQQALTIDHRKFFMYQLFRGLKYVHSAHILHRNLNPRHILLNSNCDLKISGFKFAIFQNEEDMNYTQVDSYDRCYRAPEFLFSTGEYGPEIDIWSLGCIFAELILRKQLFQSQSTLNLLKTINEKIGSPTDHDLRHVRNVKAIEFMKSLPKCAEADWDELLKGGTHLEIDLIQKMLKWDPTQRITAEEALEHPYFTLLHDLTDEPITDPVDSHDFERSNYTVNEMRNLIWNEIQQFQRKNETKSSSKHSN